MYLISRNTHLLLVEFEVAEVALHVCARDIGETERFDSKAAQFVAGVNDGVGGLVVEDGNRLPRTVFEKAVEAAISLTPRLKSIPVRVMGRSALTQNCAPAAHLITSLEGVILASPP